MPSEKTNQHTREEWRELGFFYDYNKELSRWLLVGSLSGLLKFRDLLNEYVAEPVNEKLGEHEHYGPYMYLTVVTHEKPLISDYGIIGTLSDLKRLANLVDEQLQASGVGESFSIDAEYCEGNEARLEFVLKEEGFDPASADSLL
jgi:hypothetical protein